MELMTQQQKEQAAKVRARALWHSMDGNEQHGIRFGLFPATKMREAEKEGFTVREITLALMEVAGENGGMRA